MTTRVALVHAVAVAIDPVREAFAELWPEAELANILDDSLSPDRARDVELSPALAERIASLGRYALSSGADAVLYTCSAFGPAIEAFAASTPRPVLTPNEAMFARALTAGRRLGMLATFAPSVASMEAEFRAQAAEAGVDADLATVLVEPAMVALKAGDAAAHNRLLAGAASALAGRDAIMLAHFSTSCALQAVSAVATCPVAVSSSATPAIADNSSFRLIPKPPA